ncbi:MAG: hypothetical protein ACOH5I_12815 [Oligoflexus sp.]
MRNLKSSKKSLLVAGLFLGTMSLPMACSDDDDDNVPDEIQQTGDVAELEGTWVSDCLANSILDLSHTRRQYEFGLSRSFAKIEFLYDDDACSNQLIEYRVEGNYRTDRTNEELEGKPINFEITKASLTPGNETAADLLNGINFCDIEWAAAQTVDITNKDCMGFSVREGETIFELYKIRDDNQLYFGQNFLFLQQTDSAERPTELDEEVVYRHQ